MQQRFERCDWTGIRQDTVERLALYDRSLGRAFATLGEQLGERIREASCGRT